MHEASRGYLLICEQIYYVSHLWDNRDAQREEETTKDGIVHLIKVLQVLHCLTPSVRHGIDTIPKFLGKPWLVAERSSRYRLTRFTEDSQATQIRDRRLRIVDATKTRVENHTQFDNTSRHRGRTRLFR